MDAILIALKMFIPTLKQSHKGGKLEKQDNTAHDKDFCVFGKNVVYDCGLCFLVLDGRCPSGIKGHWYVQISYVQVWVESVFQCIY